MYNEELIISNYELFKHYKYLFFKLENNTFIDPALPPLLLNKRRTWLRCYLLLYPPFPRKTKMFPYNPENL